MNKNQALPKSLFAHLRKRLPRMLDTLRQLTLIESPSLEKNHADRCANFLADEWRLRGARIQLISQRRRGDHVRAIWNPVSSPASQLLVLGHYDTVYPTGTLSKMPFRIVANKAYGPGTFDMKAGIVQALFALEALQELKTDVSKRLVFLWTSDEEIGSESSRKLIEYEARRSDAVFVLEPCLGPRGAVKTSRKGVGEAKLMVHGRAAHAGLDPDRGINAIHELAAQIARIEKWNDPRTGITVNADLIDGGTRTNVIPDCAKVNFDLRAWRQLDIRSLEKRFRSLKPVHKGVKLELHGGFVRPPLERKHSVGLFLRAKSLAKQMGFSLNEAAAGGASDGNLTAALKIPTLDGFGAVGEGAHSAREFVYYKTMPERAALLAAMLATS